MAENSKEWGWMTKPPGVMGPLVALLNGDPFPRRIEGFGVRGGDSPDLGVVVVFEVVDGKPALTSLTFVSPPDGQPLSPTTIRRVDLKALIEEFVRGTAAGVAQRLRFGDLTSAPEGGFIL
ncbi:MAG TPA: hypothetical protein VEJ87_03815, partial [Acidimicrobiales bacterium]|nr:hypothetical protein [Acidimicrobiales bacterium]